MMNAERYFEIGGAPFCANPSCPLHLCTGEPGVAGAGNWIKLANGIILGRQLRDGRLVCDACAHGVPCPV